MIVVTGASGFIGSTMVHVLNDLGERDIIACDSLDSTDRWENLRDLRIADYLDKDSLWTTLEKGGISSVVHLGARADTTDRDARAIMENNFDFSKRLWLWCRDHGVRFIYASSAAVYGDGSRGFREDVDIAAIMPLNPYAYSKSLFDQWMAQQAVRDGDWVGLRFFNVYGPRELQKGQTASMVHKLIHQIHETGIARLFKSYDSRYVDGGTSRDFVFVDDVCDVIRFFLREKAISSGVYNVGSGQSRSLNELARLVSQKLEIPLVIEYTEMPERLRSRYQYHTEANLDKLHHANYTRRMRALEDGISLCVASASNMW
nr:ADP-glyceromanno-heptose 6-epimerase [Ferrimicrobium acidiphilum]